jgi:hypothetical protein
VVDLTANTVSFAQGMDRASQIALNSSKNIKRSLTMISTEATLMATSVIGSLTEMIAKGEEYAFTVERMSQITGTSTETFSKLAFMGKMAGISTENLSSTMQRMSRSAGEAKSGIKLFQQAYAAVGISTADLNGKLSDSGALFVAITKGLDKYKTSTNKMYIEQKIFNRSGTELAPILHSVATGFDEASAQATLFGVVVSSKTAAQALQLHQAIVQVESVMLGFSMRLMSGVTPALGAVASQIIALITSADGMKTIDRIAGDISSAVTILGSTFKFLWDHVTAVKRVFEGLAALQVGSIFLPMISGALKASTGLDTIGLVAVKMVGRLSGISAILPVIASVTGAIKLQVTTVALLIREDKGAAAASYIWATSLKAVQAALLSVSIPLVAITAGLYIFTEALIEEKQRAVEAAGVAVTWGDMWTAAMDKVHERVLELKLAFDALRGTMDAQDWNTWDNTKKNGVNGKTLGEQAAEEAKKRSNASKKNSDLERFTHATPLAVSDTSTQNAPSLPNPKSDKVDPLKRKMEELANAASAAHQALMDVGKGPDFERAIEIEKLYNKVLIDEAVSLAKLSAEKRKAAESQIHTNIATQVNDASQTRYREELKKTSDALTVQMMIQDRLTRVVGKSAEAVRAAAKQNFSDKQDEGQSEEWKKQNAVLRARNVEQFVMQYDKSNQTTDASAIDSLNNQITAQTTLNKYIMLGKQAREDAAEAEVEEAIRIAATKRGDSSDSIAKQVALQHTLYEDTQMASDLDKASSMDMVKSYHDQIQELHDIQTAAYEAGHAIDSMQIKAGEKEAWDNYVSSIDRVKLAVGSASDGVAVFFSRMSREVNSAASEVNEILSVAFGNLNSVLIRMVETQTHNFHEWTRAIRNDFSKMFREISASIAQLALKKLEQGTTSYIMESLAKRGGKAGALGGMFAKEADPTVKAISTSNNWLEKIFGAVSGKGTGTLIGNAASTVASSTGSSALSRLSSAVGTMSPLLGMIPGMSVLGPLFGGLFGGHRALGGNVTAGMSYDVGEMGRETFTPTTNGRITPNNKLGGGSQIISIDARGANDPAQTEAAIHRAMLSYAPSIIQASVRAQREGKMRSPTH